MSDILLGPDTTCYVRGGKELDRGSFRNDIAQGLGICWCEVHASQHQLKQFDLHGLAEPVQQLPDYPTDTDY